MVTFSLTSPLWSFFHHFASQDFQARTLEKKKRKNLPRDAHTCRNATVACFVGRKTRGALIFRWRSSFHPSCPHPDRKLRVLIVQQQRQRSEKSISPEKWTVAATKMDNTFGNSWRFTMNRLGGGWKKEKKKKRISEYFIDNIGFYTNGKSIVPNLLRREKYWKNSICWKNV